jgi:hypothetical protein
MVLNFFIAALQINFMLISFTVEKAYCRGPLDVNDSTLLVKETIYFCENYNPLFLERPEWLVKATCVHGHCAWVLYSIILLTAALDLWKSRFFQSIILLGLGAKLYAVLFYHYMEFTSHLPPPDLLAYFGAEGAYMLSIVLILFKISFASSSSSSPSPSDNNANQSGDSKKEE